VSLIIGQLDVLTTWILYNAIWSGCTSAFSFLRMTQLYPVATLQGQMLDNYHLSSSSRFAGWITIPTVACIYAWISRANVHLKFSHLQICFSICVATGEKRNSLQRNFFALWTLIYFHQGSCLELIFIKDHGKGATRTHTLQSVFFMLDSWSRLTNIEGHKLSSCPSVHTWRVQARLTPFNWASR
jgi:hypothetical protein